MIQSSTERVCMLHQKKPGILFFHRITLISSGAGNFPLITQRCIGSLPISRSVNVGYVKFFFSMTYALEQMKYNRRWSVTGDYG